MKTEKNLFFADSCIFIGYAIDFETFHDNCVAFFEKIEDDKYISENVDDELNRKIARRNALYKDYIKHLSRNKKEEYIPSIFLNDNDKRHIIELIENLSNTPIIDQINYLRNLGKILKSRINKARRTLANMLIIEKIKLKNRGEIEMVEEKNEISKAKLGDVIGNFQNLLSEGLTDKEMEIRLKIFLKPLSENLKNIIEEVEHAKEEQDKEIGAHEEFVKILEYLSQNLETEELMKKEIELITILKKYSLLLEKLYLTIKYFLDFSSIICSEDLVSSLEKKSKLQYEINITTENLREKGIIKK